MYTVPAGQLVQVRQVSRAVRLGSDEPVAVVNHPLAAKLIDPAAETTTHKKNNTHTTKHATAAKTEVQQCNTEVKESGYRKGYSCLTARNHPGGC